LIVMPQTAKAVTKPVEERRVRKERSILLAVPLQQLVESEAEERVGAKKQLRGKSNETINGKLEEVLKRSKGRNC